MAGNSRAGFIMQGARGKLGDVVFKKAEGRTIQVQRVQPKNPKTAKQMAQRIIFATVNQAASWLSKLVDHSFEGVATGTKSIREFVRLNLNLMRQYAADDFANTPSAIDGKCFVSTKGVNTLIPNRYIVSRGTIQYDGVLELVPNEVTGMGIKHRTYFIPYTTKTPYDATGENEGVATVPALDLLSLIGIHSATDQFTFVYLGANIDNTLFVYGDESDTPGFIINEGNHRVCRLVPKADITASTLVEFEYTLTQAGTSNIGEDAMAAAFRSLFDMSKSDKDLLDWVVGCLFNEFESPSIVNTAGAITNLEVVTRNYSESWDETREVYMGSYFFTTHGGFIRSSLLNGKWLRSTCILEGSGPSVDINYGLCWAVANDAWNQGSTIASGAEFLDQGNDGGSLS